MKSVWQYVIILLLTGCDGTSIDGKYSMSLAQAERRRILVGEYEAENDYSLGEYNIIEVWIEREPSSGQRWLVVRLNGPHADVRPLAEVEGFHYPEDYRYIWPERSGPSYDVWTAPAQTPSSLILTRNGETVKLRLKVKFAELADSVRSNK